MIDILVNGRFKVKNLIGKGLFAEVYEGEHLHSGQTVAIKLEHQSMKYPQVKFEAEFLRTLKGSLGVPTLFWTGTDNVYNVIVMERLGDDLGILKQRCQGRFSLKTTLMVFDQLLAVLEGIHDRGVVNRDVKPDNFCVGSGQDGQFIYIIDFGLGKLFMKDGKHISHQTGKSILGQMLYSSRNNLKQEELSRRDDLESMFYMILHFLVGDLPWSSVSKDEPQKDDKRKRILFHKENLSLNDDFWNGRFVPLRYPEDEEITPIPRGLRNIYSKICNLSFEERPDYEGYREIIYNIFQDYSLEYDSIYDWMLISESKNFVSTQNTCAKLFNNGVGRVDYIETEQIIDDLLKLYTKDPRFVGYKFEEIEAQNKWFDDFVRSSSVNIEGHLKSMKIVQEYEKKKKKGKVESTQECNLI